MSTASLERRAAPGLELAALRDLQARVARPRLLAAAGLLVVASLSATWFHYDGTWPGNETAWLGWLLAVGAFTGAFVRRPAWRSC